MSSAAASWPPRSRPLLSGKTFETVYLDSITILIFLFNVEKMTISKLEPYLHYKLAQLGRASWLQGRPCLVNTMINTMMNTMINTMINTMMNTIMNMKKLSWTCDESLDEHNDEHE